MKLPTFTGRLRTATGLLCFWLRLLDIGGITEWKSVHDRCSELVVYSCGWLTLSNLNFTKQKLVAESILSYDWEMRNWRSAEINNRVIKRVDHPQLVQCNQHQDSVLDCQSVIPCLYKILTFSHWSILMISIQNIKKI